MVNASFMCMVQMKTLGVNMISVFLDLQAHLGQLVHHKHNQPPDLLERFPAETPIE